MLILCIRYRDMIFRIKGSFDEVMEFLRLWNTPAHTPAFFKE